MPTPTGTIKFSDVNIELARGSTTVLNIGLTAARSLAGVPSGVISMNQLRGKSSATATGTMNAGTLFGSRIGYATSPVYGSITNSKPANPIAQFEYSTIVNITMILTANSAAVPWTTNPISILMTMNGGTATLTWTSGNSLNYYTVAGNPFNMVSGGVYSWSYK